MPMAGGREQGEIAEPPSSMPWLVLADLHAPFVGVHLQHVRDVVRQRGVGLGAAAPSASPLRRSSSVSRRPPSSAWSVPRSASRPPAQPGCASRLARRHGLVGDIPSTTADRRVARRLGAPSSASSGVALLRPACALVLLVEAMRDDVVDFEHGRCALVAVGVVSPSSSSGAALDSSRCCAVGGPRQPRLSARSRGGRRSSASSTRSPVVARMVVGCRQVVLGTPRPVEGLRAVNGRAATRWPHGWNTAGVLAIDESSASPHRGESRSSSSSSAAEAQTNAESVAVRDERHPALLLADRRRRSRAVLDRSFAPARGVERDDVVAGSACSASTMTSTPAESRSSTASPTRSALGRSPVSRVRREDHGQAVDDHRRRHDGPQDPARLAAFTTNGPRLAVVVDQQVPSTALSRPRAAGRRRSRVRRASAPPCRVRPSPTPSSVRRGVHPHADEFVVEPGRPGQPGVVDLLRAVRLSVVTGSSASSSRSALLQIERSGRSAGCVAGLRLDRNC